MKKCFFLLFSLTYLHAADTNEKEQKLLDAIKKAKVASYAVLANKNKKKVPLTIINGTNETIIIDNGKFGLPTIQEEQVANLLNKYYKLTGRPPTAPLPMVLKPTEKKVCKVLTPAVLVLKVYCHSLKKMLRKVICDEIDPQSMYTIKISQKSRTIFRIEQSYEVKPHEL